MNQFHVLYLDGTFFVSAVTGDSDKQLRRYCFR